MSSAPTLRTGRLTLRAHRAEDFPALAAMWAEPAVTRFIGGKPSTPAESWTRLLRYAGLWPVLGYGYWAVQDDATGRYAGDVGFADFRRPLTPSIAGVPELGWALAGEFHGRGLGTEAVRAALAWLDARGRWPRSVCIIDQANAASERVARKAGFGAPAAARLGDQPIRLFERLSAAPG